MKHCKWKQETVFLEPPEDFSKQVRVIKSENLKISNSASSAYTDALSFSFYTENQINASVLYAVFSRNLQIYYYAEECLW